MAQRKVIHINFSDFWPRFRKENNYFINFLRRHYEVNLSDDPDYLVFSNYGDDHLRYKRSIGIFFTGENIIPDFNVADYAIGYNLIDFEDRFLRYPFYLFYRYYDKLQHKDLLNETDLVNRKFCNFIYSNAKAADPVREKFFKDLMKYKKVDSGGKISNNIGFRVQNKFNFIKDYKFTIAFENSSIPGYTTEKLTDPMLTMSLPVYYGNSKIELDFNPDSFVYIRSKDVIGQAMDEIIRLDQYEDEYLEKLRKPWLPINRNMDWWEDKLFSFFDHIFTQPFEDAFRRALYGFNRQHVNTITIKSLYYKPHRLARSLARRLLLKAGKQGSYRR